MYSMYMDVLKKKKQNVVDNNKISIKGETAVIPKT